MDTRKITLEEEKQCKDNIKFAKQMLKMLNRKLKKHKNRIDSSIIEFGKINILKAESTIKINEEILNNGFISKETLEKNDEIVNKLISHPLYK